MSGHIINRPVGKPASRPDCGCSGDKAAGGSRRALLLAACCLPLAFAACTGSPGKAPADGAKAGQAIRPRLDLYGDPLPEGAIARIGSLRWRAGTVRRASFTSDGKTLVAVNIYRSVCFFEVPTGKLLRSLPGIGCSPDGSTVATWDEKDSKVIVLVDVATGKERCRVAGNWQAGVDPVVFSPDGGIVTSSGAEGKELCLWDARTGRSLVRLKSSPLPQPLVCFSPDSKYVAYPADRWKGGEILLWEVASGKLVHRLAGHAGGLHHLTFSPEGKRLASTSSDKTLRVWDLLSGKEVRRIVSARLALDFVAFAEGGKSLVTSGQDGLIRLWDASTGKEIRSFSEDPPRMFSLALSPDGAMAVSWRQGTIRLWDVREGKLLAGATDGHEGPLSGAAFCSAGEVLATRGYDDDVRLWGATSGKQLGRLKVPGGRFGGLSCSADGKTLATRSLSREINIWDVPTRKLRTRFSTASFLGDSFLLSPDGRLLAVPGTHEVHLHRAADGALARRLEERRKSVRGICFSPDSRLLAVTSFSFLSTEGGSESAWGLTLWDAGSGEEVARFEGREGRDPAVTFSPDGRTLAVTWSQNPAVTLFELASRGKRAEWKIADDPRRPHAESGVGGVVFSHGGGLVAAGDSDQNVYLWDVRAGREVWRSPRRDGSVLLLAFHGDRLLATGAAAGAPLVWDVNTLLRRRRTPPEELPPDKLNGLWDDLASGHAVRAYNAIRALWGAPKQAVAMLGERLRPFALDEGTRARISRLVADLDSSAYATREAASEGLLGLGDVAIPALKKAADDTRSAEVRRRARAVLASLKRPVPDAETLRSIRAVETLEFIGSPGAVEVLKRLSHGTGGTPLTEEALASLTRLKARELK